MRRGEVGGGSIWMLMPGPCRLTTGCWRAASFCGNLGIFWQSDGLWLYQMLRGTKKNKNVSAAAVKAKQNVRHGQRDASVGQGQMEHSSEISEFNSQPIWERRGLKSSGSSEPIRFHLSLMPCFKWAEQQSKSKKTKKKTTWLFFLRLWCCKNCSIDWKALAFHNNKQAISQTVMKIVRVTSAVCVHCMSSAIRNSTLDDDLLQFSLHSSRWRSCDEGQSRQEAGGALIKKATAASRVWGRSRDFNGLFCSRRRELEQRHHLFTPARGEWHFISALGTTLGDTRGPSKGEKDLNQISKIPTGFTGEYNQQQIYGCKHALVPSVHLQVHFLTTSPSATPRQ